jgi:hypothetical protein
MIAWLISNVENIMSSSDSKPINSHYKKPKFAKGYKGIITTPTRMSEAGTMALTAMVST